MKKRYIAFALLAYVVFLAATVPATWLAWGLHELSQGKILLDQGVHTSWATVRDIEMRTIA